MFVFKEISIKRKLLSIIILIFIFDCRADVKEDEPESSVYLRFLRRSPSRVCV